MNVFAGNSLWALISQADFISRVVLITLVIMSVVCWGIFLYKIALLRIKRVQFDKAQSLLSSVHSVSDLYNVAQQLHNTAPGYLLGYGVMILKNLLHAEDKKFIDEKEFELVQNSMDQALQELVTQEEEFLPVLSTSASVAPLVGLFGTVWGLIHAFMRIAERQSADITTVAPGIAEALITTLAGLVVAIPALVLYHYLQLQARKNETKLIAITDRFEWVVKRSLVK